MHLPILTPIMIAGSDSDGWLVMVAPGKLRPPQQWTDDDYREALRNLADLHDYFWNLDDDLDAFANLRRPLDRDFAAQMETVQQALEMLRQRQIGSLSTTWLSGVERRLKPAADRLRQLPFTLIHGNYWADTIVRPLDGRQVSYHWLDAAIAPALLDVVLFAGHSRMYLNVALDDHLQHYRDGFMDEQWQHWDAQWRDALLWTFATIQLPLLASQPDEWLIQQEASLREVWLNPISRMINEQDDL
jgi:hypothetical protein